MKTTITISLRYAIKAYDAITDNGYLEENTYCEYPDVWVIEEEDKDVHEQLLFDFEEQLKIFEIPTGEYEIETKE